ncbi:DUF6308 family protein [Georgenia subflava]|uniref:Uncharacterized protein n=1 Tax=Georgenia subflava TaxID=1622177 RepID=A0A6N7EE67_9MICO|nr:DUF6308 family protein [Georgenia subflava]MPV36712.1 hypothetical protein [Georgenia subflava]
MAITTLNIAGTTWTVNASLKRFAGYPRKTPIRFDYPLRGEHGVISNEDIARTHAVSSRISHAERDYFIDRAADAPWIAQEADLADADPNERGGLFDAMTDLFWHFEEHAPSGVAFAKISKVLHLKHPAAFPIIDKRVKAAYRPAAKALNETHPELGWRRRTWIAVRRDLISARANGAMSELRTAVKNYESDDVAKRHRVRKMAQLTDLRLLDILTW